MIDFRSVNEDQRVSFFVSFYPQRYLYRDCELIILTDKGKGFIREAGQKENTYECIPVDDFDFMAVKKISVRVDTLYKSKVQLIEEILPGVEALARAIEEKRQA